jgi:hypothetical protein
MKTAADWTRQPFAVGVWEIVLEALPLIVGAGPVGLVVAKTSHNGIRSLLIGGNLETTR